MKTHSHGWIAGAALVGALSLAGCATRDYVREQVALVDQKLGAVQATQSSQLAAQDSRLAGHDAKLATLDGKLAEMDRTSRDAVARAQGVGKLTEGKFVFAVVLQDDGVKFGPSETALSPDAEAKLAALADRLKADNKDVYLEIQGYTDASGSKAANLKLGEARAEAVRQFLNKQGVALNRMAAISYGAEAPVASNDTPAGRAQNRRVVIVVLT